MTPRRSILVCAAFGLLIVSLEPSGAKECRNGFYKSPRGVCCKLCPAGTYKLVDCTDDLPHAGCDLCPVGTFMDRDNQEEKCKPCSSCGPDEKIANNCSVAQDTICQCTEGFKRNHETGLCLPEEPHSNSSSLTASIVLSLVLLCVIITSFFLARKILEWSKSGSGYEGVPLYEIQVDDENLPAWKAMLDHWTDLKEWVGKDPTPLLDYMKGNRTMTAKVYKTAKGKDGEECVEYVLKQYITQPGSEHVKLWNALYAVKKDYVQLWRMFQKNGDAVQAVSKARPQLLAWISKNPRHLLLQLINQSLIPQDMLSEVRAARSDETFTTILLDFYIDRGNDTCEKLLIALLIVKNYYPEVKLWLNSLKVVKRLLIKSPTFLSTNEDNGMYNRIRFKKANLCNAIKDNLEPLLSCLEDRRYFSKTVTAVVRNMAKEHGDGDAAMHVTELALGRGRANARQFWEVLWELRDQYPKTVSMF